MGRWTQYDEDEYRLPEGMKRVGYDADTGRYSFRDTHGVAYIGPEGARFGQITRVSGTEGPSARPSIGEETQDEDLEAVPDVVRADGYPRLEVDISDCPDEGIVAYWVQPGDSCWDVARAHGHSLEVLMEKNL